MYEKNGQQYVRKIGSREDVFAGHVYCTSGGLVKADLIQKGNRIISKKRSEAGKRRFQEHNPFGSKSKPESKPEEASTTKTRVTSEEPLKQRIRKRQRRR